MPRSVRVGLLVMAGIALFLVALFAIANRSFLFSNTFSINASYTSVAGLQPGAAVQFQGVRVGRVEEVQLPSEPGRKITVRMAIKENAKPLIRKNTQAQIKSDGLVGNQIVVLVNPAPATAAEVESGDEINGVEPFDLYEISDKALATAQQFEQSAAALQTILEDIQDGSGTVGKFIYDPGLYNELEATAADSRLAIAGLTRSAEAVVNSADQATAAVESILTKVNEGEGTLARLLNEDAVYESFLATADTLQRVSGDVRAVTNSAEDAANWGALGAYRFSELMEAAKHNFIFKRYFEERGYMEKAPFEVREAAIEQSYEKLEARRQELYEWEQRLQQRESRLQPAGEEASALPSGAGTPEEDVSEVTSVEDAGAQ